MTATRLPLLGAVLASTVLLTACNDDSNDSSPKPFITVNNITVVQSSGNGESMIELTDGTDITSGYLSKTETDYAVFSHGDYFYQIGRYEIDTIQKYDINNPTQGYYPGDGFSLRSAGDTVSANPYNMAFVDDNTAVITRYGSTKAWVVNLNTTDAADFLIQELDLSQHTATPSETDSAPEMDMAFISNGKLFITLQNLVGWTSTGEEQVVVFDTTTWQEVDTDPVTEGVQSIQLNLANHQSGVLVGDTIYLGSLVYSAPATGGIETVNTTDFSVATLTTAYAVNHLTANSSGTVFFSAYEGWQVNTLYTLAADNSTHKLSDDLTGLNISVLSAYGNALWVGTGKTSSDDTLNSNRLMVLNSAADFTQPQALSNILTSQVDTALKPIGLTFMQQTTE